MAKKEVAKKGKAGRPTYKVNEKDFNIIKQMTISGIPQANIGRCIGMDVKTMKKYYKDLIDQSADMANSEVAQSLFNQAVQGNTVAGIWWTKSRMGWKETRENNVNVTKMDITERINKGRERVAKAKLRLVASNE